MGHLWGILVGYGHVPSVQAAAIVLATFVLEDAATVIAAMAAQAAIVSVPVALAALYVGIVLGDLGLYGLGALSGRLRWAARLVPDDRRRQGNAWIAGRVFPVVFASRFVPGARLPTYTACGFLGADLKRFVLAAIVATSIWTSLLFALSLVAGRFIIAELGPWRWVGFAGFALTIMLIGRTATRLREAG